MTKFTLNLVTIAANLKDMKTAYWNLRRAGYSNIEAENFLAPRRYWFFSKLK